MQSSLLQLSCALTVSLFNIIFLVVCMRRTELPSLWEGKCILKFELRAKYKRSRATLMLRAAGPHR